MVAAVVDLTPWMSWIWTVGGVWLSAERVLRRRKRERADRVRSERKDISKASCET
jgi:hypothetical protein